MRYLLILLTAGLCLATFAGCGNEGPIAPPINAGAVVINDDGDGQLISREPVIITWDFVPRTDLYKVDYSTDGGKTWLPVGETKGTHTNWVIPAGTDTSSFLVRVDGYRHGCDAPRSRALSETRSVLLFGELHHFSVTDATTQVGECAGIHVSARDKWDNLVVDFEGTYDLRINWGDSTESALILAWVQGEVYFVSNYYFAAGIYTIIVSHGSIIGQGTITVQ